ncbi:hypothetical protein AWB85_15485 [Mycobacteroides immunogenum]|uniref:histidine kinase n=1 Tax=Mycobacteroides immunogenum TaxID=83262 RepID=A0A179V7D0_9MYCO|nr:histidine kinase [Mycobacteroides immunogenum]OAT67012.1 hypothetical protein AWB85_15485 [Mycobacteroides immunogenum]
MSSAAEKLEWGGPLDILLVLSSAADAATASMFHDRNSGVFAAVCAGIAVVALLFRHRAPYFVFAATVPALVLGKVILAPLVALYTIAEKRRARGLLLTCTLVAFVVYAINEFWVLDHPVRVILQDIIYAAMYAGTPVLLGLLTRTRSELSARLKEIQTARRDQQRLLVDKALARERADLAREMHDVVSHQVSLIAVQAGALQVTSTDSASIQTARTIRALSARTLDELRDMVRVLRASGTGREFVMDPLPGIGDISELLAASGIDSSITAKDLSDVEISPAVQRAAYRATQEGLTNIHKHAPGASAALDLRMDEGFLVVTLTNTRPVLPPSAFPSDQNGLLGLRERAELLGGSLRTQHLTGGGFELVVRLPAHA